VASSSRRMRRILEIAFMVFAVFTSTLSFGLVNMFLGSLLLTFMDYFNSIFYPYHLLTYLMMIFSEKV
jgi:hypothetical protein